ncbi:uncharacterized protein LOC113146967 [Cyclospora cayetanensis]|uniref:Uncharacterized protein LOC113146967 n=1 Tax=Cyclospora cayetanensis TaxID=88456 RepID=A0A6P6RUY6_9EIME|nr:uncharacterized protein LOC113146967 [Cyclospora cayetanensis]
MFRDEQQSLFTPSAGPQRAAVAAAAAALTDTALQQEAFPPATLAPTPIAAPDRLARAASGVREVKRRKKKEKTEEEVAATAAANAATRSRAATTDTAGVCRSQARTPHDSAAAANAAAAGLEGSATTCTAAHTTSTAAKPYERRNSSAPATAAAAVAGALQSPDSPQHKPWSTQHDQSHWQQNQQQTRPLENHSWLSALQRHDEDRASSRDQHQYRLQLQQQQQQQQPQHQDQAVNKAYFGYPPSNAVMLQDSPTAIVQLDPQQTRQQERGEVPHDSDTDTWYNCDRLTDHDIFCEGVQYQQEEQRQPPYSPERVEWRRVDSWCGGSGSSHRSSSEGSLATFHSSCNSFHSSSEVHMDSGWCRWVDRQWSLWTDAAPLLRSLCSYSTYFVSDRYLILDLPFPVAARGAMLRCAESIGSLLRTDSNRSSTSTEMGDASLAQTGRFAAAGRNMYPEQPEQESHRAQEYYAAEDPERQQAFGQLGELQVVPPDANLSVVCLDLQLCSIVSVSCTSTQPFPMQRFPGEEDCAFQAMVNFSRLSASRRAAAAAARWIEAASRRLNLDSGSSSSSLSVSGNSMEPNPAHWTARGAESDVRDPAVVEAVSAQLIYEWKSYSRKYRQVLRQLLQQQQQQQQRSNLQVQQQRTEVQQNAQNVLLADLLLSAAKAKAAAKCHSHQRSA